MRIWVDVHYVEVLRAAQLVHLLDERERNAGRAAKRHAHGRIDTLHGLVCPPQQRKVVRGIVAAPEARDVLLVPDLHDRQPSAVVSDDPAHVLIPCIEVLMRGARPRDGIAENRQKLHPLCFACGHDVVEVREVPFALLPLNAAPVEVAAHPSHSRLAHHGARPCRRLVARDVRTRPVRTARRSRIRPKRQHPRENYAAECLHCHCSFFCSSKIAK